ncbi:MAG: RodZ domain-containing protein [Dokdonella sp.]
MSSDDTVIENMEIWPTSLGQKLQIGRERLGMSVSDVSTRLKLSERVIRRLEADELAELTEGVFLRGYLLSYARLVGLPADVIHEVVREHTRPAPLVATGTIPRSRYLLDRWSVSATYLILTGLIVGPSVWLAMTHGGIEHRLVKTTPLDRPVASAIVDEGVASAPSEILEGDPLATSVDAGSTESPAQGESTVPVKASLAPFNTATAPVVSEAPSNGSENAVELSISEPSWVEVLKPDGTRLEYGVLPAGTERRYDSDTPLTVRIGNVSGTRLVVNGDSVDLAPLTRGNVAHLRLFGDETVVARADQ